MSENALDAFYLKKEEPLKSCLLALRNIILQQDKEVTTVLRYGMPFFCYKGKRFCYLWVHAKNGQPYIGFVDGNKMDHPALLSEKRSRMKILLIDMDKDFRIKEMNKLLRQAIALVA